MFGLLIAVITAINPSTTPKLSPFCACNFNGQPICDDSFIKSSLPSDRSRVELVLAPYDEPTSWSDPYDSIRTIYSMGNNSMQPTAASSVVRIPNLGAEQHAYLKHIVEHYDTVTVETHFVVTYP